MFERVPEDDEGQYYTDISLNYGRHAATGKFRILVVSCPQWVQSDNDLSIRPWSECSRDEKLASFEKLPALIEELANEVHKRASTAEQTVASVNAILPKKRKGG